MEGLVSRLRSSLRSLWLVARVERERSWTFALLAGAAFAALQIAVHSHHEFWRDEIHFWSVGRNAVGLWDLLTGDRLYEGHPFLWYWVLHLASHFTRDPIGLHTVAVGGSVGAALLWLRHAPMPRWLRLLLLTSYSFAYEYGIMSRAYTLGVLLTFAFCAVYRPFRVRYVTLGVLLALLAATSLYGTILAMVLGLFVFSRGLIIGPQMAIAGRWALSVSLRWIGGVALLVGSLAFVALTTRPPADAWYAPRWSLEVSTDAFVGAAARFWWGLLPMPDPGGPPWILTSYLGPQATWSGPVLLGAAVTTLVAWLWAVRRSARVIAVVVLGVTLMAAAQHTIYAGSPRHWCHYSVLLVVSAWLLAHETRGRISMVPMHVLLALVLVAQTITGVRALLTDWRHPFSSGKEAASFIAATGRRGLPIVGDADHPSSTVAGYLDQPFLYAATGDLGATVVFHNQRHDAGVPELLELARKLAASGPPSTSASLPRGVALIVANHDLGTPSADGLTVKLVYHTAPALIAEEEFFIYEVRTAQ